MCVTAGKRISRSGLCPYGPDSFFTYGALKLKDVFDRVIEEQAGECGEGDDFTELLVHSPIDESKKRNGKGLFS